MKSLCIHLCVHVQWSLQKKFLEVRSLGQGICTDTWICINKLSFKEIELIIYIPINSVQMRDLIFSYLSKPKVFKSLLIFSIFQVKYIIISLFYIYILVKLNILSCLCWPFAFVSSTDHPCHLAIFLDNSLNSESQTCSSPSPLHLENHCSSQHSSQMCRADS